jgi:ATP-dependent 26S proteasome regulatory subunit
LDRKIEFSLPDNEGRTHILKIHGKRSAHLLICEKQADL